MLRKAKNGIVEVLTGCATILFLIWTARIGWIPVFAKRSELNTWTQIKSEMPYVNGPIMFDKLTKHYR